MRIGLAGLYQFDSTLTSLEIVELGSLRIDADVIQSFPSGARRVVIKILKSERLIPRTFSRFQLFGRYST